MPPFFAIIIAAFSTWRRHVYYAHYALVVYLLRSMLRLIDAAIIFILCR